MKVLLREFSFEWSRNRISFTDSQLRSTYKPNGEVSFEWLHHVGFHPQVYDLELHTQQIVPCERTAKEVSFEW